MSAVPTGRIARAFEAACRAELQALKPGNVHVFAAGHGMAVAQFEQAAAAAAPAITQPGARVGVRIRAAVEASLAVAGCNTNLGIILLCAPLAAAAEAPEPGDLRARLRAVLAGLDVDDAREAFSAIAAASPGGLGDAPEADVRAPAAITLAAAMALAADRDRIARQYATGYADIFALGLPSLCAEPGGRDGPTGTAAPPEAGHAAATGSARPGSPGMEGAGLPADAGLLSPTRVEAAYLAFLGSFADSHIARKFGPAAAETVRAEAETVRAALPGLAPDERHARLLAFDGSLKARGLNPGTSADLTVASIFAALLERESGT